MAKHWPGLARLLVLATALLAAFLAGLIVGQSQERERLAGQYPFMKEKPL